MRLLLVLGPTQIFMKGLSRAKLLAMSWQPAILHGNCGRPLPPLHFYHCLDGRLVDFVNLSTHSPPMAVVAGRKKQSMIHCPTLYIFLLHLQSREQVEKGQLAQNNLFKHTAGIRIYEFLY
jgi:hypothetical protein